MLMTGIDDPFSTYAATGFAGAQGRLGETSTAPIGDLAPTAGPAPQDLDASALLSLRNPVTIFGLFAAVTFGLIAVSSSVRVGKARAKGSLGKV
jgi:hypothetical protein